MIEKEPGNPRIHRLRVIHLYEANYNLTLGIFWAQKLVPQAEELHLFNNGCYGSRPGLSAVHPVFLEELQVSISYLSQTNQVTFHNDATNHHCVGQSNSTPLRYAGSDCKTPRCNTRADEILRFHGTRHLQRELLTLGRISHLRHGTNQLRLSLRVAPNLFATI
jgi:hypothetical protein